MKKDYYPFGMVMPGRKYTAGSLYRYGFNGKENDNDVKGDGNQQDYGMRIYDTRLGRFLSEDPLTKDYPHYTPYSFAGNKPMAFVDLDGMEEGSLEINARRREEAYLNNKISAEEYSRQYKTSAALGTAASVFVLDIFLTKGRLTQFLFSSYMFGHLYHNPSPNIEINKKRDKEGVQAVIEAGTGYTGSKVLRGMGLVFKQAKDILKTTYSYGETSVSTQVGKEMVQVGNGGIGPGGYLEVDINVKVGANSSKVANGETVFNEIFSSAQGNATEAIKGIRGIWTYGDNLAAFNKAIVEKVNKGLMTLEEAALSETFTGKMAQKKGFGRVSSINGERNADGTYKSVTSIIFEK